MYNLIERYIFIMTKDYIVNFASKKGINLSDAEVTFIYNFLKKNWRDYLKNPSIFDIDRYKDNFSLENFIKVKKVFEEYYQKFGTLL